MPRPFLAIVPILIVCGVCASPAGATYSIAAVDQRTQQVGGAVTSCVGTLDVGIVYGAIAGVGVIHAQAQLDQRERAKQRALTLLMQGVAPSEIIQQITAPSFDTAYASRQYGLVDVMGRTAGFTGAQAQDYKHDQHGRSGTFVYSVQGNILTSQKVLDQAAAAFEAGGCDLADRLMRALEAGAEHGEGDMRCTPNGIPSDSAFLEVEQPGQAAGSYLKLSVSGTGSRSPLLALRMQFDAWRKTHPCSASNAGSAAAAGSAGTSGSGGAAAGASGMRAGASGATNAGALGITGVQADASGAAAGGTTSGSRAQPDPAAAVGGGPGAPVAGILASVSGGSPAALAQSPLSAAGTSAPQPAAASGGCSPLPFRSAHSLAALWLLGYAWLRWCARRQPRAE